MVLVDSETEWGDRIYRTLIGFYGEQATADQRDHVASMTRSVIAELASSTESCPDGECNQGMCGGISDPAGPCGGCCGCLGGCLDARSPALSGEALRDVEERDDAAGDLP